VLTEKKNSAVRATIGQKERIMKVKLIGAIAVCAVLAILALTIGTHAAPATGKATTATAVPRPTATPANASAPEKHPEIRAALTSLGHAKEHLEHAAHDFGGHRVDAIHAIDEAQRQLEICLKY
jgi:hypothetical protein